MTVVVADVVEHDFGGQTQPILAGAVSGADDDLAPPNTAAGRASAIAPKPPAAKKVVAEPDPPVAPKSRRRAFLAAILVPLVVFAGIGVGYWIIRGYYYVGAAGDNVAIMRGVPGSFLSIRLQEPFQLGCISDRNELSQISYGQADTPLNCELMRLDDLRPSERAQVSAGLPAGSLDSAIGQLRELARSSLLPVCAPPPRPRPATAATLVPRSAPTPPGAPATTTTSAPPTSALPLPPPPQKPGTDCRSAA